MASLRLPLFIGFVVTWSLVLMILVVEPVQAISRAPDVSSTALYLHKLYMAQPPHDSTLYDALEVSPNATMAQITKSYRQLSRRYHPDKRPPEKSGSSRSSREFYQAQLLRVQQAYEILKDDATRLPYHQYGLTDPNVALMLLLGPHYSDATRHSKIRLMGEASSHDELLQLMGYDVDKTASDHVINKNSQYRQEHRVRLIAARLVEVLRPLVEDTVDPSIVFHCLAQDCDRWKALPLGAQIIRCIGRAYRHSGRDYLLRNGHSPKYFKNNIIQHKTPHLPQQVTVSARQRYRQAKDFWIAVFASGRAIATEKVWSGRERHRRKKQQRKTTSPSLEYHHDSSSFGDADMILENDDIDHETIQQQIHEEEEEMRQMARWKAQQTLLSSLQVDALWKVSKIDLDKTVRKACHLILSGQYFFFPSHATTTSGSSTNEFHGWITSSGKTMDTQDAIQKAAEAMVMVGEIMVQRSKEGTSWKE